MSKPEAHPLSILTPYRIVTGDSWPGETPVEIHYASGSADFLTLLPSTDVLLSFTFNRQMAQAADSLKLIQCGGAGYENIDVTVVPPSCQVAIVYEHEPAIAEWVMMAMIALNREIIRADRTLRKGNWEMGPFRSDFPQELNEQTLGIIGLGRIGRRTATLARAFGMRVIAATRTVPAVEEAHPTGHCTGKRNG